MNATKTLRQISHFILFCHFYPYNKSNCIGSCPPFGDEKKMKETDRQNKPLSPTSIIAGVFFAIGIILGITIAHLLRSGLYASVFHLYQNLLNQLQSLEINVQDFFLLALRKNLKYFIVLCFFAFTNVWKYYYRFFLIYAGFQNGLLLSFCIQLKGIGGIIGYLCFLMPQAVLFVPAYLIAICHCCHLHNNLHSITATKRQAILCELPFLLAALALLLLGCLLEAAFNPSLLRLYFRF